MTDITSDVENNLLRNLLPKCNPDLVAEILLDSVYRRDEIEIYSPSRDDRIIQIASIKGSPCFRIQFRLPLVALFPKSAQILSGIMNYHHDLRGTFKSAFVGIYVANLNHLTVFRLHGNHIRDYFPDSREIIAEDLCQTFKMDKGSPMELSSLNFLEKRHAISENVTDDSLSKIQMCYSYSFWKIPQYDFKNEHSTMNKFIYHDTQNIKAVYNIFKTILKINKISTVKRNMHFIPRDFSFLEITGTYLVEQDGKFVTRRSDLIIAEPFSSRLTEGDIINCLLLSPTRISNQMPPSLIAIGTIGKEIREIDLRPLIAIIFWKVNQSVTRTSQLAESIKIEELKEKIRDMITRNSNLFGDDWLVNFDARFDESLKKMNPVILHYGDAVYSIPPVLTSYLISNNIGILEHDVLMTSLLRLINTIKLEDQYFDNSKKMAIRTSQFAHDLQSSGHFNEKWQDLLWNLPRLANRIVYSRIFSQPSALS